jgi:flagellar M-ring protein FliF
MKKSKGGQDEIVIGTAGSLSPKFTIPQTVEEVLPEIELEEKSEVKKQINIFIKKKPEAVAQMLRNWISDDAN